jgi:hypothetical protein
MNHVDSIHYGKWGYIAVVIYNILPILFFFFLYMGYIYIPAYFSHFVYDWYRVWYTIQYYCAYCFVSNFIYGCFMTGGSK